METPDLFNILAQPTERKPENNELETDVTQKSSPNPEDFEPAPEPELEPEPKKGAFDEFTPEQEPVTTRSNKPVLTEAEYNENAELLIATVDGIQCLTLPYLYQKSLFKKKELEELKTIKQKLKQSGETSLTERELELMDKYNTLEELRDGVELSEDEITLLKTPLGKVFKKYNIHLGPEIMLMGAVSAVMLPRYIPFISILEDE